MYSGYPQSGAQRLWASVSLPVMPQSIAVGLYIK
ncbi:hypothetical protein EMIT0P176_230063 [Pseudomonas sp. IT-P176]